jgi:hypothetical protein
MNSFCLLGCSDECENVIVQKLDSPDGKLRATVFSRNCGATTSESVHIYMGGIEDSIPDSGNVFRGVHSAKAKVSWLGNSKILISTDAETFLIMKEYAGVEFELHR